MIANHVAFFDQAITAYFKHVNYDYFKDIEETKKDFHTVQVLVQYHKPLHFEDTVEIGTKMKNIGNTSMTWIMGMFNKKSGDLVSSCENTITDELKKIKFLFNNKQIQL